MDTELDKKIEYSFKIYDDISRQIQFADTKSGLILAWHGATLFFLFRTILNSNVKIIMGTGEWLVLMLALFFVFVSLVNTISTIMPRIKSPLNTKCMFWIMDISYKDKILDDPLKRFSDNIEDKEQVFKCISSTVIIISDILKLKYEKVQVAIGGLFAGMILEIIFLLMCLYGKN